MSRDDKLEKAIAGAMADIEKAFGKGAMMRMTERPAMTIERIPTGVIPLDMDLGGGLAKGRIHEIYGPESSGKTTLCYHAIAQAQKAGGYAAFIDSEHAMDPGYAAKLGVDMDRLFVSQPDNGEQALQIADKAIDSGAFTIVVVDSVAALTPKAELDGEIGDAFVGLQARMMSQAMRRLAGSVNRSGTTLIFTNQLREKVGVTFGSPETTPGGKALKFYASIRIDIRRIGSNKDGEEVVSNNIKTKIVKNKTFPPFRQSIWELGFGTGFDREGYLLDQALLKDIGLAKKNGSFFTFVDRNGEVSKSQQGRPKAKAYLKENPEVADFIFEKVMEVRGGVEPTFEPEAPELGEPTDEDLGLES